MTKKQNRIAIIKKELCNPSLCDNLCVKLCPINKKGEKCIDIVNGKAQINETLCIGCGICVNRCPFKAIDIINLPSELDQPVHQYGRNGFHLYNLPIPVFGKVVGILGRNAIGKSTAMKILSGLVKPNLGHWDKDLSYDEVIEFFKGTENQKYFTMLKEDKIKVSYKPQQIEMLARLYKGKKVGELIDQLKAKLNITDHELKKFLDQFELDKLLDRDISYLSGGEMQRLALLAALMKKAQMYFIDEPSSYLDIKQRLKMSKFINNFVDQDKSVMVIEHDLIVMDYISDIIHIIYGKEAAYGVVSLPRSSRKGINAYLSGYLREENVRFRDKPILFDLKHKEKTHHKPIIAEWHNIKKKLGKFELSVEKGNIEQHEIIGIIGENGIGKTSFVKLLAGDIKPDSGEVQKQVKVAYKPQYIEPRECLVSELLGDIIIKYKTELIIPLEIEHLINKKMSELSGGELQRVAIAYCLGQDADLYLLDEPSAYLDVEQRLRLGKIIKDFIFLHDRSAIIVDHDLLFIDYISDRLIVFRGEPAIRGYATQPLSMHHGMNLFLKDLEITFRRDKDSLRPRVNKPGSVKDREQKLMGEYYYIG